MPSSKHPLLTLNRGHGSQRHGKLQAAYTAAAAGDPRPLAELFAGNMRMFEADISTLHKALCEHTFRTWDPEPLVRAFDLAGLGQQIQPHVQDPSIVRVAVDSEIKDRVREWTRHVKAYEDPVSAIVNASCYSLGRAMSDKALGSVPDELQESKIRLLLGRDVYDRAQETIALALDVPAPECSRLCLAPRLASFTWGRLWAELAFALSFEGLDDDSLRVRYSIPMLSRHLGVLPEQRNGNRFQLGSPLALAREAMVEERAQGRVHAKPPTGGQLEQRSTPVAGR